jgi:hypothetical protein
VREQFVVEHEQRGERCDNARVDELELGVRAGRR